jgi:hypothetical protein
VEQSKQVRRLAQPRGPAGRAGEGESRESLFSCRTVERCAGICPLQFRIAAAANGQYPWRAEPRSARAGGNEFCAAGPYNHELCCFASGDWRYHD